jgi:peptidyl-prolyl cis-trans isomerase C
VNAVSLPLTARETPAGTHLSTWRRYAREPLLHFALIGAAIFAVAHFVEQVRQESQVSVIVDAGLRGRLENLYRTQFGVAPTATQLQVIVDDYIDDEVLHREALRLGLAEGDEIIRRRLIQKLEFLQRDTVANSNPAPAELRAYYDAHPEKFSATGRASFSQMYFGADRGGDARAQARASEAREALLRGDTPAGDDFPLEHEYSALTRDEVTRIFGGASFVDGVFSQRPGEWSEPLRSGFGWHLVKVTAAEPARLQPFEQALPEVRAAWLQDATVQARRKQLDALRGRYHIVSRGAAP